MTTKILTYEEANELLKYDPGTGIIIWREWRGNQIQAGSVAGNRDGRYESVKVKGKLYLSHRLAWLLCYGRWPKKCLDHINGDQFDNRINNLREATLTENQQNAKLRVDNKTGVTGVYWHKQCKQWQASIRVNNKLIYLGIYQDWWNAVCARKAADAKYGFSINHGRM